MHGVVLRPLFALMLASNDVSLLLMVLLQYDKACSFSDLMLAEMTGVCSGLIQADTGPLSTNVALVLCSYDALHLEKHYTCADDCNQFMRHSVCWVG